MLMKDVINCCRNISYGKVYGKVLVQDLSSQYQGDLTFLKMSLKPF